MRIPDEILGRLDRPGTRNATPGWRVLEALRGLHSGGHGLPDGHPLVKEARKRSWLLPTISAEIGERYGWNQDRGCYLTRAQAQQCIDINSAAIEALNEKLSDRLSPPRDLNAMQFRERDHLPNLSDIPREELRRFYDDVWSGCRGRRINSAL